MTDEQKVPFLRTLPVFVRSTVNEELQKRGRPLPGRVVAVNGSIVTVSFDVTRLSLPQMQMPIAQSEYIQIPVQVGDLGIALPASIYIGCVTGLGVSSSARPTLQGNLSDMVWLPLGNSNWSAVVAGVVLTSSVVTAVGNMVVGNGWTGTFVDLNGQVITVQNGIIVNGE